MKLHKLKIESFENGRGWEVYTIKSQNYNVKLLCKSKDNIYDVCAYCYIRDCKDTCSRLVSFSSDLKNKKFLELEIKTYC